MDFDLDAYCARIGFHGARTPSLETLAGIHRRHTAVIAFENLDPFLGRPVHLDMASLQRKIVQGGRGGWCFEQNLLFGRALREIGFEVTDLAARVLSNATNDVRPRSHMLLLVKVHGKRYVADVGFGGQTLTCPLRLETDVEQVTPHEPFRLLHAAQMRDTFEMQSFIGGNWRPLYRFDLQEQFLSDYEVTNWYLSNHPQSPFVNALVAARADRDCRYALRNRDLAVHYADGATVRRTIQGAAELRDALEDLFLLTVRELAELDAAFERLPAVFNT